MIQQYTIGTVRNDVDYVVPFTSSKAPFGWLGNMTHYPCVHNGVEYRTGEHMFQSMRFEDKGIIALINKETNPYKAKVVAKHYTEYMSVKPMSEQDIKNMVITIESKIRTNHEILRDEFQSVLGKIVVEDVTQRMGGSSLFWGAALIGEYWVGMNVVGKIWSHALHMYYHKRTLFV